MLCAQHALNALLQGNYYDPSQLAEIAKRLDELEHSNVDEATWNARDEASLNMDDTGEWSARTYVYTDPGRQGTSVLLYWKVRYRYGEYP